MSKITNGCRSKIQLSCVKEKKKESANKCKESGYIAHSVFCKLAETGRDRLPNVRRKLFSDCRKASSSMAGAGRVIRFV